jgi:hypothetical protein
MYLTHECIFREEGPNSVSQPLPRKPAPNWSPLLEEEEEEEEETGPVITTTTAKAAVTTETVTTTTKTTVHSSADAGSHSKRREEMQAFRKWFSFSALQACMCWIQIVHLGCWVFVSNKHASYVLNMMCELCFHVVPIDVFNVLLSITLRLDFIRGV